MKNLLIIPLLIISALVSAQTYVDGYFPNGMRGKKIPLTDLTVSSSYLTTPTTSSLGFDSSKVVTDVILNSTLDSFYIYRGGTFLRAIKIGGSSGTGWSLTGNTVPDSTSNYVGTSNLNPLNFGINGIVRAKISTGNEFIKYGGLSYGPNGVESGILIKGSSTTSMPGIDLKNTGASGRRWHIGSDVDGSIAFSDSATTAIPMKIYTDKVLLPATLSSNNNYYVGYDPNYFIYGLWFGTAATASRTYQNYSVSGDGTETQINSSTGNIYFRKNGSNPPLAKQFGETGDWVFQNGLQSPTSGNSSAVADMTSAQLQLNSFTQGSLPNRLTAAQRDAIQKTITGVQITSGGTGYTNGATMTFSGGGVSGAAATVQVSGGVINAVVFTSYGTVTTAGATTASVAGGTGATFTVLSGWPNGLEIFCTDCTATNGVTGVKQTWSGGQWNSNY